MGHTWVLDRLQMNYIWATGYTADRSWINYMRVKHCCIWVPDHVMVTDGSSMVVRWVTNGSHMSLTLVALSNTTFLIFFFKLINLWPCHNLTILRIWKMNAIFNQSEESNPVVSLITLLWRVTSWFFAHRVSEIIHLVQRSFARLWKRKSEVANVKKWYQIHL